MARPHAAGLLLALCASLVLILASAGPAHGAFGYLRLLGSGGTGDGQFFYPAGLVPDAAGNLYVVDQYNFRVQKVDVNGNYLAKWGSNGTGNGQFHWPVDVAVGSSASVYVVEGWDWAASGTGSDRVQKFDANGGFLLKWGGRGSADGQFVNPSGIATDPAGNVYVVDNNRIQKFDPNGVFLKKWGEEGFGPGQFRGVMGIAIDSAGSVFTLESEGKRVQKFDSQGNFISQFSIADPDVIAPPWAMDVDASGSIYVTTAGTSTAFIRRFAADGTLTGKVPCRDTAGMWGVAAHPNGKVYTGAKKGNEHGLAVFGEGGGSCDPESPPPSGGEGGGSPGGGSPGGATGLTFNGAEGVTIDNRAQFTNDADVELSIVAPGGATEVKLSNDGGFLAPASRSPNSSRRYSWTLESSGPERLPKTVYVRFAGPGGTSPLTFSDDIILDQTPPTISQALLSGGGSASALASAARARRFTLRVRAKDNVSGLGQLQLATNRRKPAKPRKFQSRLTITARRPPAFVRVRDRAGNYSKWRRVRR